MDAIVSKLLKMAKGLTADKEFSDGGNALARAIQNPRLGIQRIVARHVVELFVESMDSTVKVTLGPDEVESVKSEVKSISYELKMAPLTFDKILRDKILRSELRGKSIDKRELSEIFDNVTYDTVKFFAPLNSVLYPGYGNDDTKLYVDNKLRGNYTIVNQKFSRALEVGVEASLSVSGNEIKVRPIRFNDMKVKKAVISLLNKEVDEWAYEQFFG